jgi:phage terminase small subunit
MIFDNKLANRTPVVSKEPAELRADELRSRLAAYGREMTSKERRFAEIYTRGGNMRAAYCEAFNVAVPSQSHSTAAWRLMHQPEVAGYVQELQLLAAHATVVDVSEILASDIAIVRAARFADELSHHVYDACRYCYGVDHKYHWRDASEFDGALAQWLDACASTDNLRAEPAPATPSDEGGYGFDPRREPLVTCPQCEGRGTERTVIADTSKLTRSKPLYRGMKVTKNGIEVLMHDVDKAKERLLRAAGAFGDDAASVAKGAAAGAAAGAAIAQAVAVKAKDMSVDDVRKAYLGLVS